ncbi:MAG: bacillithiol system redox-active protein YtxJ [bacterium]
MDKKSKQKNFLWSVFALLVISFFVAYAIQHPDKRFESLFIVLGSTVVFWRSITALKQTNEIEQIQSIKSMPDELTLNEVLAQELAVVYKHSTRCPVSMSAFRQIKRFAEMNPEVSVYLVNVIEQRHLSNLIAERLGIRHQSPQVIVLNHGRPVWQASHEGVQATALAKHLR